MKSDPGKINPDPCLYDPIDISVPLRFNGESPNVYGADTASSKPCEYGEFLGDTRRGGSVNFEQYTFIPHCNGTHTECVGHITNERISVRDCLEDVFSEALLVSVEPDAALDSVDRYPFELEANDHFISKDVLTGAISAVNETLESVSAREDHSSIIPRPTALIVRTLPNDGSKLTRRYDKPVPPFFSNEAVRLVVDSGFKHLLVDLPSIDRLYDGGMLSNHRIFWNVPAGQKSLDTNTRIHSTITELIYVPDKIVDGKYILNLQIAPFEADAAPSRPILLSAEKSSP